ncbi:MAG: M4 family metallopeptidase [Anaerolineales bacterium]|nr:M4 family metallopeptidase [Anaerolineales bacterium]
MKIRARIVPLIVIFALVVPGGLRPPTLAQDLVFSLTKQTDGFAKISYHAETGKVRFIATDKQHPIQLSSQEAGETNPELPAREFLRTYGSLFGIQDADRDLKILRTRSNESPRTMARFQQVYRDIPVLGGEIIVNLEGGASVLSASGEALPDIEIDINPLISAQAAVEQAKEKIARQYQAEVGTLTSTPPELWIYNPILLGGPGPRMTSLVWKIEISSLDDLLIRQWVLVDAHRGFVVLNLSQVYEAKNRSIYDNLNSTSYGLPGNGPVCTEGICSGPGQAYDAYLNSGYVYDFYSANHLRDSINGGGMTIITTVRYCKAGDPCPYDNAYWNGAQMVFGDTYATDDILAHEYTHGVTDYESGLFYYMQSGAINESFSDIWGELVDLGDGWGNDSAGVRWLMGEDIGASRSMSNPPAYEDPDKMTSSLYNCDLGEYDNGGVHTNSGIGNKAAYLMVDGGTFNGRTVTALGATKTAKIFYQAQTNLLTSASDYNDLYDALQQACTVLIGPVTTASDCQEVKDAVDAVEMNLLPTACPAPEALVCTPGQTQADLFFDNMENTGSGNWVSGALSGINRWYYPQNPNITGSDMTYATSGQYNIWGYDQGSSADYFIAMANNVSIPGGANAYLHFNHSYHFDGDTSYAYDGGVIEYSLNGGAWTDAGALIEDNGYKGTISSGYGNPLGGRQAFVQKSSGYISSRLNLSSLAGNNVKFRYRIGTDASVDSWGWFIDDVRIYTCSGSTAKVFLPLVARSSDGSGGWTTIKSETFEGTFPGDWLVADYFSGYGEYYWGKRNCRSYSGSYSGWAVGGGASGNTLACGANYPVNINSWMIYGPFNLASATAADLSFQLWLNSELTYDKFCWWASIDGEQFYGICSSGNTGGWVTKTLDLTDVYVLGDLRGLSNVWIGLTFYSDYLNTFPEGAYVDDILLRKCMLPTCTTPPSSLTASGDGQGVNDRPAHIKRTP